MGQLRPLIERLQSARLELCTAASPQLAASIQRAGELVRGGAGWGVALSPLERSDRAEEMGPWLHGLGVDHPADAAEALADLGYTRAQLAELTSALPSANIPVFLSWIAEAGEAYNLLAEIGEGAGRISQIVGAMRSYAYLDQAPVQEVDITEGLENTLVLLGSKLKTGVVVQRNYAEHLPRIQAHGSELNQVWTSIIENAIDAIDTHGTITVRTSARDGYVLAEIEDDGPGLAPEIAARVFDPFFTTSPPAREPGSASTSATTSWSKNTKAASVSTPHPAVPPSRCSSRSPPQPSAGLPGAVVGGDDRPRPRGRGGALPDLRHYGAVPGWRRNGKSAFTASIDD